MSDEGLHVRFSVEARKSPHTGEWQNVEYVTIHVPGDKTNIPHRPVEEKDKRRFGRQYEAFKRGLGEVHEGQPLKEWAAILPAEVMLLSQANVYTVEQLASVSDANAQTIGPILALRDKARRHVEQTKQSAPLEAMHAKMAEQAEQIAELKALLEIQTRTDGDAPARRRPGRPPKSETTQATPEERAEG
jgi:alkylhydroperoxidase family enzyme